MGAEESVLVHAITVSNIFEWDHPVIRRGGVFNFSFKEQMFVDNLIEPAAIRIHMVANGDRVDDDKITYASENVPKSKWNLKFSSSTQTKPIFCLETPCDCEPGEYEVTIMNGSTKLGVEKFLMLFNPWNPDDQVYMPDEENRKEYILNTKTTVYMGSEHSMINNQWSLDQFSLPTIETLLYLLTRIDRSLRSNAFTLVRELTSLTNHIDNDGILVGRWDGQYIHGKPPHYWVGSKQIFEKYMKEKRPVKYGQCFTFAALLCSIIRLLGIGCRVISCFDCLHDTDDTLDMEVYYDKDYNFLSYYTRDSIWNFHCWTECYMEFPDCDKYNGWQVCDATPQEASRDGRYTCGPSPVTAVKAGDLKVGYDSRYVFSEVNGDVVYKRIVDGKQETFEVSYDKIGHKISTKAVGSDTRVDITNNYKYVNDTLMHIMVRKNAGSSTLTENLQREKVIRMRSIKHDDHILMGEDLDLIIELLRISDSDIDLIIRCFVLQHPNIRSREICQKRITFERNSLSNMLFKVESTAILNKVQSDLCEVLVEVFIKEKEKLSRQDFKMTLRTPNFDIVIPKEIKVCQLCKIKIKMNNPLPYDLIDVFVRLEIVFSPNKQKTHVKKIRVNETLDVEFQVVPNRKGFFEVRAIIYGPTIPTFNEVASVNVV